MRMETFAAMDLDIAQSDVNGERGLCAQCAEHARLYHSGCYASCSFRGPPFSFEI